MTRVDAQGRRHTRSYFEARWIDKGAKRSKSFQRKLDADRFVDKINAEQGAGTYVDPRAGLVPFDVWAERWWANTSHLRPSSRARSDSILHGRLVPHFVGTPLSAIRPSDVTSYVKQLEREGLAPGSIRKVFNVLRSVMGAAVEDDLIRKNPCAGAKLAAAAPAEMRFLSPEEISGLVAEIPDEYRALVLVAAYGGLRFGELAGLHVRDVDFLRRRVTVRESLVDVGGRLYAGPTKTGRLRSVSLPPGIIDALSVRIGKDRAADEYVFTSPAGGPLRRSTFRTRVWLPALQRAGLQGLRFHDLRHTAAALAIAQGAHPKAIQERLGHKTVATTMDLYGHLLPALDEQLADRLQRVWDDSGTIRRG